MMILLIIAAIAAAIYIYAAIAHYYNFKNWHPICGGKGAACDIRSTGKAGADSKTSLSA